MIDVFSALSIAHNFEKSAWEHLVPVIMLQEYDPWRMGTPVIADKRYLDHERMAATAITLMTTSANTGGMGYVLTPDVDSIKPFGNPNLITDHKLLEIDYFDPEKVKRLLEYVHDVGSISLCIVGEVGQRSFPADLRNLVSDFRFHTGTYFNSWLGMGKHLNSKKDSKITLVNMFDVSYCMPIFNNKKVDGIGISYNIITEEATMEYGQPHRIAQLDIILSNYDENLFIVDGAILAEPWVYDANMQQNLNLAAAYKLIVASSDDKRKIKASKGGDKILTVNAKDSDGKWSTSYTGPTHKYVGTKSKKFKGFPTDEEVAEETPRTITYGDSVGYSNYKKYTLHGQEAPPESVPDDEPITEQPSLYYNGNKTNLVWEEPVGDGADIHGNVSSDMFKTTDNGISIHDEDHGLIINDEEE